MLWVSEALGPPPLIQIHPPFQETFPLRVPEWLWAGFTAAWGWNILINPTMFADSAETFSGAAHMMPQSAWGMWAVLTGAIGLVALGINGLWRATPFIRTVAALGRMILWVLFFTGLSSTGKASTGTVIYMGLVAQELWNIYRAMGDARAAIK